MRLTAFVPPPPAPTTLITARYEDSTMTFAVLVFRFALETKAMLESFGSLSSLKRSTKVRHPKLPVNAGMG